MPEEDLYEQLIAAADGIYGGPRDGIRALHAKGAWCEGTFTASPEAGELSRAFIFSGRARSRPSSASPTAPAIRRPPTSSARRVASRSSCAVPAARSTTSSRPARRPSSTRTPEEFLELLAAAAPGPRDGPTRLREARRLPRRPSGGADGGAGDGRRRPAGELRHRRVLLAAHLLPRRRGRAIADRSATAGSRRPGRSASPTTRHRRADATTCTRSSRERLAAGTIGFGSPSRSRRTTTPSTIPRRRWPDDRELVDAGRLEITAVVHDPERDDHIDVFDPLRLADGIEPSDDPILHARRRAYSVSAYRRWGKPPGPVPGE